MRVQYTSRGLGKRERGFSTFELKAVAIIISMKTFRYYLLSAQFIVYSDHNVLRAEFEKADIHDQLAKSQNVMAEYEFQIKHIDGRKML